MARARMLPAGASLAAWRSPPGRIHRAMTFFGARRVGPNTRRWPAPPEPQGGASPRILRSPDEDQPQFPDVGGRSAVRTPRSTGKPMLSQGPRPQDPITLNSRNCPKSASSQGSASHETMLSTLVYRVDRGLPLKKLPERPIDNIGLTEAFGVGHRFHRINPAHIDMPGLPLGGPGSTRARSARLSFCLDNQSSLL
jgi:hypothetical protein